MGKNIKLAIAIYLLVTGIFFIWMAYELAPNMKYRLNESEKRYLTENIHHILFVGDEMFPPFSYTSDNVFRGYEADLMVHIMEELGVQLNYKQMNWSQAIEALEAGEISAITGMKITEERRSKFYFTDPYLITTQAIVTPSHLKGVSLEDIKNLRVIVQENSITHTLAIKNNAKEILLVRDPMEGIDLLMNGKGDAWLVNNMTARHFLKLRNIHFTYNINVLEDTYGYYGMAISKNHETLVNIMNKMLYKLNDTGTIAFLDNKWFGMVGYRPFSRTSTPFYYAVIAYVLITITFVLYIWNKTLHYQLTKRTKALRKANSLVKEERENMKKLLEGIATAFATAIDYRDSYTGNHSRRVAGISYIMAKEMKLSEKEIFETYLGALVHDVGKVGIPDGILRKEETLTDEEYGIIKQHPVIGRKILDVINSYETIKNAVYYHHERYDGRTDIPFPSYPGLMKGEDIPFIARIISVADAFDAMITDRPYRKALSTEEAIRRLKAASGKQFDPTVVDCFLAVLEDIEEYVNDSGIGAI